MVKYLTKFKNHSDYNTYITSQDKILPNLSYCELENEVHFNPWVETRIVCKFNVTDTSNATKIMQNNATSQFSQIEIDGVVQPSVVDSYTFDTTGEHTVKYTLTDPTSIGQQAFYYCNGLTSVIIPDSVTTIGDSVFNFCSGLTSVTLGNSVTTIGGGVFYGCSGLANIEIPNSVTTIGDSLFYGCTGLTSIVVDSGNTTYDSRNNCNAIIETATNTLIAGCKNTVIPNSVTSIDYSAFRSCSGLTSVTIPDSVTSIGQYAFESCAGLTSVTIPNSVTTIGNNAFQSCSNLRSVTIPDSVTSIGNSVFSYCGLTNVTIGNNVTTIGSYAFSSCKRLTSVTIPDSVTSIGSYSFQSCIGITSITIGNSVTTIGVNAFNGCTGIRNITSLATTAPTIQSHTFQNIKSGGTLTVPSGSTGYDVWMGTGNYYLGKYSWTKVEQ